MLTSGQGNSAGPLPLPVSPEQVVVMLGPLVAAAAYRGSNHSHATTTTTTTTTTTKTDLSFRVGHAHNTTSPLDDTGQASSGRRHQDNTVNANYSSTSLAGALFDLPPPPAALNSTHQLIRNLLFQANNDNNDTTTYNSDHHNFTQYHHHETITTTTTRGPFTSYEWLMIVTLVTIILISIVGNLLVCVAIFTDRRLRKLGNAFIVSLAIADLFVSFLVMTFALHNDLMEQWIFGAWFCDIWISFDIMCCTASILNLCAISLDRFIHIKDCLLYNQLMTRRVAISAVIMIWIISGLVSFVPITLGWHRPSVVAPNSPPGQAQLHLAAAADDDIARTTTQLPVNLASAARSKRAAPQIAHKLNYAAGAWARAGAASGHDADGHLASEANEPIGSADASSLRRLNMTQEAGLALLDPAANGRDRDRGEGKQATLMRANERAHASRVAGPTREPKKPNLGEEQIKHLPRARRRRQVAAQSTGRASPTLAGSSSSGNDYDGEDQELARGQLEREQTSQRAHSTGRQFDARALDTGREPLQAPGAQPAAAAAQCMLTLTPTYAVISSTISFYIPCIIMLGLYSKLFACARRHVRNIKAISKAPQPIGGGGCTTNATNNNAANNNHISSSSGSGSSSTTTTGNSSRRRGRPAGPLVNCARRLIGARSNQRKSASDAAGCITGTTCGPASTPQAADKVQRGKLARCVGSRARTWIKLRAGGGGGESATQNSTKARCASNRENVATTADNDNESGARLVLKSILSNQKQQHRDRPAGHSQLPRHGAEDNNTLTHSGDSTTASANAELEPFLAGAGGGVGVGGEARKSLVSTNALGVKLNMIGADAAASVGAGAGASAASARSPMHQNQNQNQQQQQQERQLHARLQQQQQQPPQPLQPTKQQTSQLATHKAAITLGIIMGTFLLCWLPFFCLNIIKAFYGDLIPAWLFRAFTWLGYANSALNPIIYGIHNSEFRNAFNRIFFKHLTLKNGRQYLNRRFSYDLRPHHHHHHHQNSNNHHLTVAVTAQTRRRINHSDANNNNNISSQQSAQTGPIPMIVAANAAISSDRPNELVGLARGEVHAQNNKPQCAQPAATAAPVKINPRAAHGQGRASSLAMGSSLDPYDQRQQCLNLLNCLQERAGQTSTAPSISNTTVHRTSEDLSQGGVRVAAVAQVAPTSDLGEQPTLPQQVQPQTVAIS